MPTSSRMDIPTFIKECPEWRIYPTLGKEISKVSPTDRLEIYTSPTIVTPLVTVREAAISHYGIPRKGCPLYDLQQTLEIEEDLGIRKAADIFIDRVGGPSPPREDPPFSHKPFRLAGVDRKQVIESARSLEKMGLTHTPLLFFQIEGEMEIHPPYYENVLSRGMKIRIAFHLEYQVFDGRIGKLYYRMTKIALSSSSGGGGKRKRDEVLDALFS